MIDLTQCQISTIAMNELVPILVASPMLEEIVLSWNHHTASDVSQIASLIGPRSHDRLRRMEFLGWTYPLFDEHFVVAANLALTNAQKSTRLQILNIGGSFMLSLFSMYDINAPTANCLDASSDNVDKMCDLLGTADCPLQSLTFWLRDRTPAANKHLQCLFQALANNSTLLAIEENNTHSQPLFLDAAASATFIDMIQRNQTLTRLSLGIFLFCALKSSISLLNEKFRFLPV